MVKKYEDYILTDKPQRRDLWELGWSETDFEPNFDKLRSIYLSLISDSLWLQTQLGFAPIGREYLLRELVPRAVIAEIFHKHFPQRNSSDYGEMLREIRTLQEESSFEFANYTKQDCIREGFFQVYSQKSLDDLKALYKGINH